MALMKRSRNGEPPGKKQQEIKVTAKTPYSVSKTSGGKVKLKNVKLDEANDKYTPEKANVEYESAIKGGKMVSIYDKSVDPTTRKLVLGAIGDSDPLGKRTDIAIERGKKYTSYDQMYDVKGFNPEEFKAAARGKDFDKYLKQKGYSAGQSFEPNIGYYAKYETASDIKKQKDIEIGKMKSELGDPRKLKVGRLEQMKPGKVSAKTTGGLRMSDKQEAEKPTWANPTKTLVGKVASGFYTKGGDERKVTNPINKAVENVKRRAHYAKEEKQFKSYYGAPSSIAGSNRVGMTADELGTEKKALKTLKGELKADIKKGSPIASRSELRSELKNVKKDIRATGRAEKYFAGNLEARSVGNDNTVVMPKDKTSAWYFKPELGEDYSAFSKSQQFRSSTDNAVNKNKTFGRKVLNANKKN
jgi:hypothetical protein